MKIGFIGLGQMGTAIAERLIKGGHELTAWNRSPEAAQTLAKQGAVAAKHPVETMQGDVLFSMLANDEAMREVGLDATLLDKAAKGLVHANLATISPTFARALAAAHESRGLGYVATPVYARPDAVKNGQMVVVAAGPDEDFAKIEPLLAQIGRRTVRLGEEPEKANLFKIAGNFMIASALETMGEAAALLRKGGVDPAVFIDVLTGGLFASPVYQGYGKAIAAEKYEPPGFLLRLGYKDAALTLAAAKETETPMPLASLLHDHFLEAIASGWGDKDWSALARLAAQRAGLHGQ